MFQVKRQKCKEQMIKPAKTDLHLSTVCFDSLVFLDSISNEMYTPKSIYVHVSCSI